MSNSAPVQVPHQGWAVLTNQGQAVGYLLLSFRAWPEDGCWLAECVELRVPSFGVTVGEALSAVLDATVVYLNAVDDAGERDRVLAEAGISVSPVPPAQDETKAVTVRPEETVTARRVGLVSVG